MIQRHKALIGYLILALGVALALYGVVRNAENEKRRDEILRGVVCRNITRSDEQTLLNAKSSIVKELHLSQHFVREAVHKQLITSAQERKALAPGLPPGTCSGTLTVLRLKSTPTQKKASIVLAHSRTAPTRTPASPVAPAPIFHSPAPRKAPAVTHSAPTAPAPAPLPTNPGGHTPHGKAKGLTK